MIKITKATGEDFDSIFLLLKQLWLDKRLNKNKTKKIYLDNLHDPNCVNIVAKSDGNIVGFASLLIRTLLYDGGKSGYLDELIVDEKYRNRGIGRKLMREITKMAKKKSCVSIDFDSGLHRKGAHKFYVSLGFEKWGYFFCKDI